MSRKFLDDHVRKFGSRSELPGGDSTAYDAGHEFQDRVDGTIFKNEGTKKDGAIYGAPLANRYELVETFNDIPALAGALQADIITANFEWLAASVDKRFFVSPDALTVVEVNATPTVAGSDGGAVTAMIENVTSTTAIGSGSDVLAATFDLKATANTNIVPALNGTAANLNLVSGSSLALDFTGTLTAATGAGTVKLVPTSRITDNTNAFDVVGTNAATGTIAISPGGGVLLTTDTADQDQMILSPTRGPWVTTTWGTSDRVIFETNISIDDITDVTIWAGLKLLNDNVVATDDDQAFVRFEAGVGSGFFQFITSSSGTDVTTTTTLAPIADTDHHIKIVINENLDAMLFINGVLLARLVDGVDASTALLPFVGVENGTTAARALTVRGERCAKDFTV